MATTLLCMFCTAVLAQAPGANYTADMPSVERVKAEIKGSDPADTLARQVAVFTYLSTYIQRIKYKRSIDGPYTPEELRVMGAYDDPIRFHGYRVNRISKPCASAIRSASNSSLLFGQMGQEALWRAVESAIVVDAEDGVVTIAVAGDGIHVQNSGGPFTLTLLPDNTLRGSGSTIVNGRLVTGMQGDNVTYAPAQRELRDRNLRSYWKRQMRGIP